MGSRESPPRTEEGRRAYGVEVYGAVEEEVGWAWGDGNAEGIDAISVHAKGAAFILLHEEVLDVGVVGVGSDGQGVYARGCPAGEREREREKPCCQFAQRERWLKTEKASLTFIYFLLRSLIELAYVILAGSILATSLIFDSFLPLCTQLVCCTRASNPG